ncbi:putative_tubulin beta chain [Hexamita inflata]|uniref:Tubulin beta chain n=1 Tax=Hexamita inflata TaxID=28002 RepID=A0AA86PRA4_9EUKA|nr:putative tubulin beta chain [Hexamita inflata]
MMHPFKCSSLSFIKDNVLFNLTCQTELLSKSIAVSTGQIPEMVKSEIQIISASQNKQNQTALIQCAKSITQPLEKGRSIFSNLFRRRVFLQIFQNEGMEELEFQESLDKLQEQIQMYKQL